MRNRLEPKLMTLTFV